MHIETSIYINASVLENISRAARINGITRTELIVQLMKKLMKDMPGGAHCGRSVRYQDKSSKDSWRIFHVQLSPEVYEYFLDLRKCLKMSVSSLVALAVKKYLNQKLKINFTDNYQFQDYCFVEGLVEDIKCWVQFWGIPSRIGKKPLIIESPQYKFLYSTLK